MAFFGRMRSSRAQVPSRSHPIHRSRTEEWTTELPSAAMPMTGWFGPAASRTRIIMDRPGMLRYELTQVCRK